MQPKLINCRKPEQVGSQEYGRMLKRIQVLEDGGFPAKETKNWRIEVSEACEQVCFGRFYGARRRVELCERKDPEGKRRVAKGRR